VVAARATAVISDLNFIKILGIKSITVLSHCSRQQSVRQGATLTKPGETKNFAFRADAATQGLPDTG